MNNSFQPPTGGCFFNPLDKNEKFCYTYDVLNRVTARTVMNATTGAMISTETFTYDAAGNITGGSADTTFVYDTSNRLVRYNDKNVSYDPDGNMLNNGCLSCMYDSANRLLTAGGNAYTYNAEDVRIKNVHYGVEEKYTYNTNCKLSKMLTRTVGTTVTKYVYGLGLISEETNNIVKVYHFDYRGSTVVVTDSTGATTDLFTYDTYGKITSRVGSSDIIFCYNGRDGVVTDSNNLIYMRARYYSSEMRRFINADIIAGEISESITLNRYAYANGNPVSNIDPFGLSADRGNGNNSYYLFLVKVGPWGDPNTHVTFKESGYWKERWFDSDGRAVFDRHWSDHGNSKIHPIPHDQKWDWSNPEHPYLPGENTKPSNPSPEPSSEGAEPWSPENSQNSSEEKSKKDNEAEFHNEVSMGDKILVTATVIVYGIAIVYVCANDFTGVGTLDDMAIFPLLEGIKNGLAILQSH